MRLQRLTGLEREKIVDEYAELMALSSSGWRPSSPSDKLLLEEIVGEELADPRQVRRRAPHRDHRRVRRSSAWKTSSPTRTWSSPSPTTGYIKRSPLSDYRAQGRGGKGRHRMTTKDGDFVEHLFVASAHSYVLVFTANLLEMRKDAGEKVKSVVPVRGFGGEARIVYATKFGTINRMRLDAFRNMRREGLIGIALDEGDQLVSTLLVEGDPDFVLATRMGQAIRFPLSAFRDLGRGTRGVRGVSLDEGDEVIGMVKVQEGAKLLTITEKGFGKQTDPSEYRVTNRGGKGIINVRVAEKNGPAVCLISVLPGDEVMAITKGGMVIRTGTQDIRETGRDSMGVIVIRLDEGDMVQDVAHVVGEKDEEILPEAGGLSSFDGAVGESTLDETVSDSIDSQDATPESGEVDPEG
jgi:DNA gyrase subunit A